MITPATATTATPSSRLEQQRLANDELRQRLSILSADVTRYQEGIVEIDEKITTIDALRASELTKVEPSAAILRQCDQTRSSLNIDREAAAAAVEHASRRADDARGEVARGVEACRLMQRQAAHLKDAIIAQRQQVAYAEQKRSEMERDLAAWQRRERDDRVRLAEMELAFVELVGVEEKATRPIEHPLGPKMAYGR